MEFFLLTGFSGFLVGCVWDFWVFGGFFGVCVVF